MKIESIAISELVLDPNNFRTHDEKSIESIASSLSSFGQRKPVVITNKNVVVTGNGTVQSAKSLGWEKIDAVRIPEDWSEDKIRAFALADNRTAEFSNWDAQKLIDVLKTFDASALEQVSFSDGDIEDLSELIENPFITIRMPVAELKKHPKNYQEHPDDQLEHIIASIRKHGFYRNIVIARDNTILAGHGVVAAATKMGKKRVPVIRLPLDPNDPKAIAVLTSDNEISNLAEVDDRQLTELLKNLLDVDGQGALLGTGFDEMQLAGLTYVTRPKGEIGDKDVAKEWVGMPDYIPEDKIYSLNIRFESDSERAELMDLIGATLVNKKVGEAWAIWWPEKARKDINSIGFVDGNRE